MNSNSINKLEFTLSQIWGVNEVVKNAVVNQNIESEAIYSTCEVISKLINELFDVIDEIQHKGQNYTN